MQVVSGMVEIYVCSIDDNELMRDYHWEFILVSNLFYFFSIVFLRLDILPFNCCDVIRTASRETRLSVLPANMYKPV